jgi:hypothetical protein
LPVLFLIFITLQTIITLFSNTLPVRRQKAPSLCSCCRCQKPKVSSQRPPLAFGLTTCYFVTGRPERAFSNHSC